MTNLKWNALVVDETPTDRHSLKTLLKAYCPQVKVKAEASNAAEAIVCIQNQNIDLVFCNTSLPDGDVFAVIDQVKGFQGLFIIVAPNDGFALRAFRYQAYDYLIKPISVEVLLALMERLEAESLHHEPAGDTPEMHSQKQKFGTILLNAAGVQHVVHVPDIIHLEGDGNYATVHLSSGDKILVSKPLKFFEDVLPARYFYRVHQSHIVNLSYVKSVQNGDVQLINLNNGNTAPLARRKKDPFLMWLARQ